MRAQDRLEVQLVDAVRRLGRRPVGVGTAARGVALGAARDRNARQLQAGDGRPEGDIVRKVRWQAGVAHLGDEAETAVLLHRSRGNVIALDVRRLVERARLSNQHLDAASGEIDRQRQADRAAADHDDIGILDSHRHVRGSAINRP
jgi:hypothetical protein